MTNNLKIHFAYTTAILLMVIVVLITVKTGDSSTLVAYVSFGTTITSLIVGVLAIVYAFFSNSMLSQNIASLNKASDNISESAVDMVSVSQNIVSQLGSLPDIVRGVDEKVEKLPSILREAGFTKLNQDEITTHQLLGFDQFISRSSLWGLYTMYICAVSHESSYQFDQETMAVTTKMPENYLFGYLVCAYAGGFLNLKREFKKWTITDIDSRLTSAYLEEIIIKRSQKRKVNPEEVTAMIADINTTVKKG